MSVKKLVSYITDNKILLRSDHLPLKKFLLRNTKNDMVNNWAMELQQHTIEFEYIQGVKNTLADTMSRLVKITPDIEKDPEKPDQEFGRFIFEKIDPILVETVTLEQDLSKPQKQEENDLSHDSSTNPIQDCSGDRQSALDCLAMAELVPVYVMRIQFGAQCLKPLEGSILGIPREAIPRVDIRSPVSKMVEDAADANAEMNVDRH